MPRDLNGLRKLRWCTFETALEAVFRHNQKDGGELLFILAQLKTSVWGGDALPSPRLGGSGRRGRAAAADEGLARAGPAAGSPTALRVPSGPPSHDSGRRSGHGRGEAAAAAATERTASQSRTGTFGFPPRAGAPSRGGGRQHLLPSLLSPPPGDALRRRSGPQRRGNSGAAKRPGRAAPEERAGARRRGGYKREGAGGGRKWAVQLLGVLLFRSWASRGASSGRPPVQAAVTEPLAPRVRLFPSVVSARGLRDLQAQHGAGGVGVPEPEPAGGLLGGGAALRRRD